MVIKIKNKHIVGLGRFLLDIKLKGKTSRLRTKFVKMLDEYNVKHLEPERMQILKDHNGVLQNDGSVSFNNDEDKKAFLAEFEEWENEEFIIDVNEANIEMLKVVKDILNDYDGELNGQDALDHDSYCEYFDEV